MTRRHVITVAAAAIAALALAWLVSRPEPPTTAPRSDPPRAETGQTPAAPPVPPVADPLDADVLLDAQPLVSGKTLRVARETLPESGTLRVPLRLGQPEAAGTVLQGRIVTEGRMLELTPAVGEADSDVVAIDVPTDWLTPGRYIVEVRTSEISHIPLRRYAIEVE